MPPARRGGIRLASATLAAALSLGFASCGGERTGLPPAASRADRPPEPSAERRGARTAADALPDLVVANTAGGRASLRNLAPRDGPLLVWFWAPH